MRHPSVTYRLESSAVVSQVIDEPFGPNTFPSKTQVNRIIRICVPDEWYRRSKSRLSSAALDNNDTLKASNHGGIDDDEEEGGTAKQNNAPSVSTCKSADPRQANRLSSIFDSWLPGGGVTPAPPALANAVAGDRSSINVSKPVPVLEPQKTGLGVSMSDESEGDEANDAVDFERMLVSDACELFGTRPF
jgi:diaphanous 1